MIHARDDYNRIQDPAGKIPADEPVFLLRAQDALACKAVAYYAELCEAAQAPEVSAKARAHADRMAAWPVKKTPDLAPGNEVAAPREMQPSELAALQEVKALGDHIRYLRSVVRGENKLAAPVDVLKWCAGCGEGVTNFCRGKSEHCPVFGEVAAPAGGAVCDGDRVCTPCYLDQGPCEAQPTPTKSDALDAARTVTVPSTMSADEANKTFGEAYGVDWAYPPTNAQDNVRLREAIKDAADEYSRYIVEDTAPITLSTYMLNAFDAAMLAANQEKRS